MKCVITGASGLVGKALVEKLCAREGLRLIVVGRSVSKLRDMFPHLHCSDYTDLNKVVRNADLVIHLAVANNHANISDVEIYNSNVKLLEFVIETCAAEYVKKIIFTSSTHVTRGRKDLYSQSKRKGEEIAMSFKGKLDVKILRLPAVFSPNSTGKQRFINILPNKFQKSSVFLLNKVVPISPIDSVCDMILDEV